MMLPVPGSQTEGTLRKQNEPSDNKTRAIWERERCPLSLSPQPPCVFFFFAQLILPTIYFYLEAWERLKKRNREYPIKVEKSSNRHYNAPALIINEALSNVVAIQLVPVSQSLKWQSE